MRCRDTGGTVHGLWCSQDIGPGVANCTMASRSSFTLAAQMGPELEAFGLLLTRVTVSQYIQRREALAQEARLEALLVLLRERFGWIGSDRGPSQR